MRIPLAIGIAAVIVSAVGATVLSRVVADYTQPFVTAPPGTVTRLCFGTDMMKPCNPDSSAPLTSRSIVYHIQRTVPDDVHIAIASISNGREHQVLVVDIGTSLFGVGGGEEFSTFECKACTDNGSYVGRAWAGSKLIGEGFFTMGIQPPPPPYYSPE